MCCAISEFVVQRSVTESPCTSSLPVSRAKVPSSSVETLRKFSKRRADQSEVDDRRPMTLIVSVLALIFFAENRDVNSLRLLSGAAFIFLGGVLVSKS